jgi:hypothetical protein
MLADRLLSARTGGSKTLQSDEKIVMSETSCPGIDVYERRIVSAQKKISKASQGERKELCMLCL